MQLNRTSVVFWAVAITAWSALLIAGSVWIRLNPSPRTAGGPPAAPAATCRDAAAKRGLAGFIASKPMARNHRIGPNDLDWATGTGGAQKTDVLSRYSTCVLKAGDRLIPEETQPLPATEVPVGRAGYPLPLTSDPRLLETINAGSTLDVWDDSTLVVRGVRVLAIQCRPASANPADKCSAILDAAIDDVPRLLKADPTRLLVIGTTKP